MLSDLKTPGKFANINTTGDWGFDRSVKQILRKAEIGFESKKRAEAEAAAARKAAEKDKSPKQFLRL